MVDAMPFLEFRALTGYECSILEQFRPGYVGCVLLSVSVNIATPAGYEPDATILAKAWIFITRR